MRKIFRSLALLALLAAAPAALAQVTPTAVTGTVTDVNGIPYSGANITFTLATSGGQVPSTTPCTQPFGCQIQNPNPGTAARANGAYSINLFPNASILPASSTYNVTISETNTPPPLGTGPQVCTQTGVVISGATQTLNFTACPALSNVGNTGAALAGNTNAIYASPACPTTQTGNCYFVNANAKFVTDATWLITSSTINTTTNDPPFTNADTGKIAFGTSASGAGGVARISSTLIVPLGTITFVSSHQVTISTTSTAACAGGCTFLWGTDDTANLAAITTAQQTNCATVILPTGGLFFSTAEFNGSSTYCSSSVATSRLSPSVYGQGATSTYLIPTPNFNWTTCTSSSCLFAQDNYLGNFSVYGGDYNNTTSSTTANIINLQVNSQMYDVDLLGWAANNASNLTGLVIGGTTSTLDFTQVDGFGNFGISATGPFTSLSHVYAGDVANTALSIGASGSVASSGSWYGGGNGGQPTVNVVAGGNFYSDGDEFYGNAGIGGGNDSLQVNGTARIVNANIKQTSTSTSVTGLHVKSGGTAYVEGSSITATGASATGLSVDSGAAMADVGGNTFSGTTRATINGIVYGSNSITGALQTQANIGLTSGWGTSTVGTAASCTTVGATCGTSQYERFTISASGAPAAGPVLTVTFPTAFLSPPLCTITQTAGTFGVLTNPAITSAQTSATITFAGTPVATQSYTFELSCTTP